MKCVKNGQTFLILKVSVQTFLTKVEANRCQNMTRRTEVNYRNSFAAKKKMSMAIMSYLHYDGLISRQEGTPELLTGLNNGLYNNNTILHIIDSSII